ncbi:hypothetical protein JCM16161A_09760 [Vulcanisaeta sp. JCM 16161]|uniref:hypothetical protein n=1 Tax=Vulcanisaeta sp. JCM 16161 TaxID=1295372 RepID=UPI00406C8127
MEEEKKKDNEENIGRVIKSLQNIASDKDLAYPLRNYAFRLMRLHDVDLDLYKEELMDFLYFLKSTEKVSQDIIENISRLKWPKLREVLVSIIPYLNIKGEEQVTQPTQSAQG